MTAKGALARAEATQATLDAEYSSARKDYRDCVEEELDDCSVFETTMNEANAERKAHRSTVLRPAEDAVTDADAK